MNPGDEYPVSNLRLCGLLDLVAMKGSFREWVYGEQLSSKHFFSSVTVIVFASSGRVLSGTAANFRRVEQISCKHMLVQTGTSGAFDGATTALSGRLAGIRRRNGEVGSASL